MKQYFDFTGWQNLYNSEKDKEYFIQLSNFLDEQYSENPEHIFPTKENVFKAYKMVGYNEVKVVIIGQDPYPTPNVATGLSFGVSIHTKTPQSLNNIFKEVKKDTGEVHTNKTLEHWARQGVFMLNTILTINSKYGTNSHKKIGWEQFTKQTIQLLNERDKPVIFLLWGNYAKNYNKYINSNKHFILETSHPTNMSYRRGFENCEHFKKTNIILRSLNQNTIHW